MTEIKMTATNIAILLLFMVQYSTGQTLSGSASFSVLDEPFQFTCTASESTRDVAFRRDSTTVCRMDTTGNTSTCSVTQSLSGYTCTCDTGGMFYLNITRTSQQDAGGWLCDADNSQSPRITLTVYRPPAQPSHNCPSSIVLGQTGSCTCQTSDLGNPAGTMKWLDPGNNQVSESSSPSVQLNLASVPRSNNKRKYTCNISNSQDNKNTPYTVDIKFGPSGVRITGNVQTEMYNNLTLICTTTGPVNPNPTLTWKNSSSGSEMSASGPEQVGSPEDGGHVFQSTLTIYPHWHDNNDIIVCEGRNPSIPVQNQVTASVQLDITFPPPNKPDISGLPSGPINEGTSVTLTCRVVGGRPLVTTVTLYCPGGHRSSITRTEGSTTRLTTLTFPVTRALRNQTCVCSGENPAGSYDQKRSITKDNIYYAPDLAVTGKSVVETQTALISCVADGNPENYNFAQFVHTWEGHPIRNVSGQRTGSRYQKQFSTSSYQDSGVYLCSVSNGIADSSGTTQRTATISLQVHARPKLTAGENSRTTVGAALRENITLSSTVFSRSGVSTYTWSKGGKTLGNVGSSSTSVELDIYGVRVQDTGYRLTLNVGPFDHLRDPGEYSLRVCNSHGCLSLFITLIADGPPAVPTQFKIFKILETAVDLTWKAEFPGGAYTQVFVVEYRRQGENWEEYNEPVNGTEGELVTVELTGLTEGTQYEFRVHARNTRISNNHSGYTTRLQAVTKGKTTPEPNVVGPVAAAVTCVVAAVAVGVVVFVLYRRGYRCSVAKPASKTPTTDNVHEEEKPYVNVASVASESATYERLATKSSSLHNYDQFTPKGKRKGTATPIAKTGTENSYENVDMQIYANANVTAKVPKKKSKNDTKDPTYANTKFIKSRAK